MQASSVQIRSHGTAIQPIGPPVRTDALELGLPFYQFLLELAVHDGQVHLDVTAFPIGSIGSQPQWGLADVEVTSTPFTQPEDGSPGNYYPVAEVRCAIQAGLVQIVLLWPQCVTPKQVQDIHVNLQSNEHAMLELPGSDRDCSGPLSFVLTSLPLHGKLFACPVLRPMLWHELPMVLSQGSNQVVYFPDTSVSSPLNDSFSFHVSDGELESIEARASLTVLRAPPARKVPLPGAPHLARFHEDSSWNDKHLNHCHSVHFMRPAPCLPMPDKGLSAVQAAFTAMLFSSPPLPAFAFCCHRQRWAPSHQRSLLKAMCGGGVTQHLDLFSWLFLALWRSSAGSMQRGCPWTACCMMAAQFFATSFCRQLLASRPAGGITLVCTGQQHK